MKNIHILPTDKPSRLYLGNNENFVFGMMQTSIQSRNDDFTNQNIYITSDEEIKEGDYRYNTLHPNEGVFKVENKEDLDYVLRRKQYKKIILTDNPDLIKDGVQAIDDEFLEWFVKNSSCEEVVFSAYHVKGDISGKLHYKITIQKEGPKQETPEQIEGYCQKLISKFKQDPKWELQQEFGRMLMRHIDSFTEEERNRYEELKRLLSALAILFYCT